MNIKSGNVAMLCFTLCCAIILLMACGKRFEFEIDDKVHDYSIHLRYSEIGDPSRLTQKNVWYWNDTIIINGVKNGPTKDTVFFDKTSDYYGIDTLVRFEKYKAKNWYIKQWYLFSPW